MKKTWLAALLAASILGGCTQAAETGASKTTTSQVTRGDLQLGLTSDGKVALPVTNLNFELEGLVKRIYVSEGDLVKKGDLLAELDDTDYQLGITNAQNNLDKAKVAYEDAKNSYEYSIASDEKSLASTAEKLSKPFDDYSYQTAIADAEKTLAKRKEELADAEKNAREGFDSYSYDNTIKEAEISLERKKADLADAQAALDTVLAKRDSGFDDYTYQNSINSAQTTYDRKLKDYNDAYEAFEDAQTACNQAIGTAAWADKEKALDTAEKNVATAKQPLDDAKTALDKAKKDLERARASYNETWASDVTAAEKKVASAQSTVDDAERSLEKAKTDRIRALEKSDGDLANSLKTAESNLADAKSALEKAQTNLTRARDDYNKTLKDTQDSYELQNMSYQNKLNSTASITNAQLNIAEAELKLQEAQNELEKVKVYAPLDGQIISLTLKEGERAAARTNTPGIIFGTGGSSGSFITLCDLSEIYLTASITEGDIVGIEVGQIVKVTVDSLGDRAFYGKVLTVSNIPTTDSNGITTYQVTCKLDESTNTIKDGMNALLNFIKMEKTNVLLIPNKAVFVENGKQYVNVVTSEDKYEKREVSCGLSNGTSTEVLKGLELGETVVVGKVKA